MFQLTVTVFGTGIMGSAMARNIVGADHAVHAWSRMISRVQPLADDGIEAASTTTAAVKRANTVITMPSDDAVVAEVIRETVPAMHPGAAWLQMATVDSDDMASLAVIAESTGILSYDSSVSGIRQPAESDTLVIMTADPASGCKLVTPILDAVGSHTARADEDGVAATPIRLELVVNSWVTAVSNVADEIVILAKAIGVPSAQLFEVLDGDGLGLPFLHIKADLVERGAPSPTNSAVDISDKGARLILELAREAGLRLDGMEAFSARLDRVAEAGHAHEDMTASCLAGLSTSTRTS